MQDELVTKSYLDQRLNERFIEQEARLTGYLERRFNQLEDRLDRKFDRRFNELFNLIDKFTARLDDNDAEHAIMRRDIDELKSKSQNK